MTPEERERQMAFMEQMDSDPVYQRYFADLKAGWKPLTPEQRQVIRTALQSGYDRMTS